MTDAEKRGDRETLIVWPGHRRQGQLRRCHHPSGHGSVLVKLDNSARPTNVSIDRSPIPPSLPSAKSEQNRMHTRPIVSRHDVTRSHPALLRPLYRISLLSVSRWPQPDLTLRDRNACCAMPASSPMAWQTAGRFGSRPETISCPNDVMSMARACPWCSPEPTGIPDAIRAYRHLTTHVNTDSHLDDMARTRQISVQIPSFRFSWLEHGRSTRTSRLCSCS
jgi:hypothetical protein